VAGADFVWDTNTSTNNAQDGAGTWTEGAGNWFDETNTLQNQNWSNAAGNTAVFGAGGTAGNINVSGTVNVGGMIFRSVTTPAYALQGSGTIALADGSSISFGDGTSNATSTTTRVNLNAVLSGNNITLQKTAGSTQLALVNLGATNTLTGTLSLRSADATGGLFVQANSLGALNSATLSSVDVGTNATLVLAASGTYAVPFTLAGSGSSARGAIRFETANITLTGAITLAGDTRITQNTNAVTTTINSNIGETGSNRALTFATQGTVGPRTMILGGNNTFTGGLTIEIGEVRINNSGALNSTAPNLVTFSGGGPTDKALSLNGFSVAVAGLATTSTTAVVRNANASAATLTIQSTVDRSFAGSLADGTGGGALSVVKSGASAQTLSGNNTFTGGLTLNQGTLNVNSATALGATASIFTINGGTVGNTSGGDITNTNNNAMVWNANFTANLANALHLGTGNVSLGTAAGTSRAVTVTGAGALTVGGTISDGTTANALTKSGGGTMVLSGSNTYTGVTTVSGGILRIANGNALGSTAAGTTAVSGGRLQLEGNITVTGEALETQFLDNFSGNNTWAGTIQCALGTTLNIESLAGNLTITGNVNAADTANAPHSLLLTGAGNGEISGVISNTFNFNKTGAGTWILSGANTYTSATNVNGGTLQVGKNGVGQTGTGAVTVGTVGNPGRLTGTGFVRGATVTITSNSFLYAGDGIANSNHGTLTFITTSPASYNLNAGSTITLSLGGATVTDGTFGGNAIGSAGYNAWVDSVSGAGTHDRLVFDAPSGSLVFSSNVLVVTDGFNPSYGQAFNLLDWAEVLSENFNGFSVGSNLRTGADDNGTQFDLPELSAGWFWDVSRFTTSGVILVVPEPGRMLLVMLGLAALVMRRRR
jgi:autotransporter-associated beta strand protein